MSIRIIKKPQISKLKAVRIRIIAVLLAILTSSIFILALSHNPYAVFKAIFEGSFGSKYRIIETIIKTIPLVITSLGIMIAFKMKFWNIGGEGQIMMGAFMASFFALNYEGLPKPLLIILMIAAGFIGGGLWGIIPAFFKVRFGTNETIFTLMMNYIAIKWITYLQYGPWKDPMALGFPKIPNFTDNAIIPKVFGIHGGWIIALILMVVIYIFMNHTKKGYEIAVVGESQNTASYAGMNVKRIILFAMFISGGLCGITGMVQASAVNQTLSVELSAGYGFTAIITTWLSGLNGIFVVLVSFLFAVLIQGGSYIQTAFEIPQAVAQILQSLILFFVLGSEFFIKYRFKIEKHETKEEVL